VTQREQCKQTR